MLGTNRNNRRPQEKSKGYTEHPKTHHRTKIQNNCNFLDSVDKLNNRKKEKQNKTEERGRKSTSNLKTGQKKLLK